MSDRDRRGTLIKNDGLETARVPVASGLLRRDSVEEVLIPPDGVQNPTLRKSFQERFISTVRLSTSADDKSLRERLDDSSQ